MDALEHVEKIEEAVAALSEDGHVLHEADLWTSYEALVAAVHDFRKVAERYQDSGDSNKC